MSCLKPMLLAPYCYQHCRPVDAAAAAAVVAVVADILVELAVEVVKLEVIVVAKTKNKYRYNIKKDLGSLPSMVVMSDDAGCGCG